MEDLKSFNIKDANDFNSEIEFDSEILARSNIDFNSNKQKYSKTKAVIYLFFNKKSKDNFQHFNYWSEKFRENNLH